MDYAVTCETQTDKVKHKNEDIDSFVHKKSSKKSKSKKKKGNKKESKKHKKRRRQYSSSSSSSSSSKDDNSDKFEWVEKNDGNQSLLSTTGNLICKIQENQVKRDEWMNVESFIPNLSKPNAKLQKCDTTERDRAEILNKPGQSSRELNPYWKNGGDGLPQNYLEKSINHQILDANWLKKSLQRAKEQALQDGKSLEEVVAERWGSLDTLKEMIIKAERISNAEQNKLHHKRSHNDRSDKNSYRISKKTKHSRSRSRSREGAEKYNKLDYSLQCRTVLKQTYQKPKDDDDYYQQATPVSNRVKNWKKDKNLEKERDIVKLSKSESKESFDLGNINNANEIDECKNVDEHVLTEAEMNKLGARIVKAELMGDDKLAMQLKTQLEYARKHLVLCNFNVQESSVILTRTDAKGIARPIQPRSSQLKQEKHKKKKIAETHISGERVRHFIDDDKYSLQEMFQREKGRSASEDDAIFAKLASTRMDRMDETFERKIAQTDLEARQDKLDRIQAIKEHKDLSKSMDNCLWCLDSKNMLKHLIVTMDCAISLSLPACASLSTGHCILTPVQHVACQLQLDEDVWNRLKELKRTLTKMFMAENLYPIFFEMYKRCSKFSHMQLECIPLPKEIGELAPMYFKKALLECETEWSVNKKIVDLANKGIRHAIPNGLSYFMVEFASHPGYAHVIEDDKMFPQNFAQEIIGGMLDLDHELWRKPKRQSFEEQRVKVLEFTEKWKKYNFS
ncbi:hypothetical protein PUN28_001038 [Cardiocondyla obscurior]|uniref:CWF19-like protein 2 n=1 Tax=Cardiocondyla obscurior TaxID=286306 RepID=A0AAW2H2J0_9HYME